MGLTSGRFLDAGSVELSKLAASVPAQILATLTLGVRRKVTSLSVGAVSSIDVSTEVVAASIGAGAVTLLQDGSETGIYTGSVANAGSEFKVILLQAGSDNGIEDSGDDVYGKLTESGGVFTLSFFKASDNTAYTFPAGPTSIDFQFPELVSGDKIPSNAFLTGGSFGLIDANIASTLAGHLNETGFKHKAANIEVVTAGTYYIAGGVEAALAAIDAQVDANTTAIQGKADSSVVSEIDQNVDDLIALSGVAENTTDLGIFAGSTIPDGSTIKAAIQSLESGLENQASSFQREAFTLTGTDITNKYVDLAAIPATASNVRLMVKGAGSVLFGIHFTIIDDGVPEAKRLTWDSADAGVSTGMESDLIATDVLDVYYEV